MEEQFHSEKYIQFS